jgi:hypothetical protein
LRGHLEGWPQGGPGKWPSFETRREDAALLRMRSVKLDTYLYRAQLAKDDLIGEPSGLERRDFVTPSIKWSWVRVPAGEYEHCEV